jgi:hypothetical protein
MDKWNPSMLQQKHGEILRNKRKTPLIQLHFLSKRFRSIPVHTCSQIDIHNENLNEIISTFIKSV